MIGTSLAIGLGVAQAVAGVASAAIGSRAAGRAAATQSDAALKAAELQKQAADESLAFQKEIWGAEQARQAPFLEAGQKAIGEMSGMPQFAGPTAENFQADPGYQFRLSEGTKALERSAAARGGLLSGGTAKAMERYSQDFASNEYANVYSRAMGEYLARFNQLGSIAGMGQVSAGQLGAGGQAAAGDVSRTLMGSATNIGEFGMQAARARASGYLDTGKLWGGALQGGTSNLQDLLLLSRYRYPKQDGSYV